jgi:hypothetical protein
MYKIILGMGSLYQKGWETTLSHFINLFDFGFEESSTEVNKYLNK